MPRGVVGGISGIIGMSPAAPLSPYLSAVLTDSPLTVLMINQTSGLNVVDSSGNGRHGVITDPVLMNSETAPDGSLAATFAGGYISIPSASWMDLTEITVEFWFKTQDLSVQTSVLSRDSATATRPWDISMPASGAMYAYANNTTGPAVLGNRANLDDNNWHHFAWGYSNSDQSGWHMIDGILDKSYSGGGLLTHSNIAIVIGARPLVSGLATWPGSIWGVAIYGSRLNQARVAAHYAAV